MTEVRDWQKDNDRLQEIKSIFDAPGYIFYGELNEDGFVSQDVADASGDFEWLIKQVEAEKERADDAEGKAKFWEMEYYASLREFAEYRTKHPLDKEGETK
ncbi:hypothetical protein RE628_11380 [Paenibacillus sp. D2_2]|uniref:hypothetical protein n=1 Tax=Paenibacillus sp. D2_2 TaxID=3073092 RepID=UPI0028163FDC|nr:hypothetical protein [Paenibacillus sp. D2_2]WMT42829.1 hypothetical protein RE628_11380 [Paenibacillus sp. D2_2]